MFYTEQVSAWVDICLLIWPSFLPVNSSKCICNLLCLGSDSQDEENQRITLLVAN